MQDTYGGNIFGLQHETMTKSPIQNVIALFKELPQTCTLHVITHSRGGLVGDVLARFSNGHKGFSEEEIAYLQKTNRKTDVDDIRALQKLAAGKNIRIEKFIRVACPAYGTTILSKRLDHFLNISCNLLSLAGGAAAVIGSELKALIAAAVDTKNDPNELPGLEAMNPDSPFLKVLNNPANVLADSPLTVISGNCGMKFNLKALLIIASKLFYLQDNDLVVDTRSMYCGARRKEKIRYFFDEGPEVDHVHYFQNKNTQEAMLAALKAVGDATQAAWATGNPVEALANAVPYMQAFGHTVLAWIWLDVALSVVAQDAKLTIAANQGRISAGAYFYAYELPKIEAWLHVVNRREPVCANMPEDAF